MLFLCFLLNYCSKSQKYYNVYLGTVLLGGGGGGGGCYTLGAGGTVVIAGALGGTGIDEGAEPVDGLIGGTGASCFLAKSFLGY